MDDKNNLADKIESLLSTDFISKMEGVKDLFANGIAEVSLSSFLDFLKNVKEGINEDLFSKIDDLFEGKSEEEREKIREIIDEKIAEKYKK